MDERVKAFVGYVNDAHVFFAGIVFACGTAMHWFHRLDATYVSFAGTVFGFLLGHACWGQNGDK